MIDYKNVYIADCDKNGGIYHYLMADDGELVFKEKTELGSPMYLAIENSKMYVLVRENEDKNSAVFVFDIDSDGRLSNKQFVCSTLGEVGCHLSVLDGQIFAANYISGSVFASPNSLVTHSGIGVNLPRQDKPHCHFAGVTPDKKYILLCDLGLDTIFTYDKRLNLVSKSQVPSGFGCRHLAFSENGELVYCVNELKGSVSVFGYNGGLLRYLNTYDALPEDFTEKNTAAAIRVKNGYVYVTNRGHNSVACLGINGKSLEKAVFVDCGGEGPRDMDINGDFMLCTNEQTGDVTVLKMLDAIPRLTDIKISGLCDPLCVIFN